MRSIRERKRGSESQIKLTQSKNKRRTTDRKPLSEKEAIANFRKTHWSVYQNLQKRADEAWAKLRADVNRKASAHILTKDRDHLLLLLGECNYMAGECLRTGVKKRGC